MFEEGDPILANFGIYEADPSYSIRTRLAEYCEILASYDDYSEFSIQDIEEELKEAIHVYCASAEDELDALIECAHKGIEDSYIDISAIEDMILSISSIVRFVCERRDSWGKMYYQMQSDEYEVPITSLSEALEYHTHQQRTYEDEVDDEREREHARLLKVKAIQIYQYIAAQTQPVTKEKLAMVVSGYSDRALAMAVSRNDILNYRGLYFCIKHVEIDDEEKNSVCTFLRRKLTGRKTYHIDDLYDDFVYEFSSLVRRAYVQSPYQLFSLIEVLFTKEFNLARPFIAALGVHIISPQEHLTNYLRNHIELQVKDFVAFAKEKHIKVNSILELIVSLNDLVLLKDRETIIRISETGITEKIAQVVVKTVTDEVRDNPCIAIRDLTCLPKLPTISLNWDEWLLYSVLRKWGKSIVVHTTSTQFRQSVPVVALPGAVTEEKIAEIAKRCADLAYTPNGQIINNLDDLDDLILGYNDLDMDLEMDFELEEGIDE